MSLMFSLKEKKKSVFSFFPVELSPKGHFLTWGITFTESCRQHLVLEISVLIVPPYQISFDLVLLNQIELGGGKHMINGSLRMGSISWQVPKEGLLELFGWRLASLAASLRL